jgi:low temperature requirement protein LtrA
MMPGVSTPGHDTLSWTLLRPPRLRTLEDEGERHASWLELFFDVVFVVAIAQLAEELVADHSLRGFAVFVALFLPVFIAWQGFTIYSDRFDTDDAVFRLAIFAAMFAIAALAVQVPDVAHGESSGFVVAYVVLRSLMVALYLRSYRHVPAARPLIARYAAGYSLGISLWLVSLVSAAPGRYVLWGVALAWEYSLPVMFRRFHAAIPVSTSHVPERFALFTIIVLGETIVAVALGTAGSDWALEAAVSGALGFVAAAALWWIYFGTGAGMDMLPTVRAILVFTHFHIPVLAALTAVSGGVALAIQQSPGQLDDGARWALCGGAAVYLACLTVAQRALVRGVSRRKVAARAATILALVVLALAGEELRTVAFAAATAAIMLALVVFEVWAYRQAQAAQRALSGPRTPASASP